MEHCVVWGQYLKYGIDEHGEITYSTEEYKRGSCDESLGALYSYDLSRFVFDPVVGNYVYVTGSTLNEMIDYDELESEINRILDEQDFNFSSVDVQTSVYFAQEAVTSYQAIRLESIKAQRQHDDYAITAKNVPAGLKNDLNNALEKEAKFKEKYAFKVFEFLSKRKPELIRRRDNQVIKWEDAFGNDFSKLPPELWASLVALVEEKGGQYRINA